MILIRLHGLLRWGGAPSALQVVDFIAAIAREEFKGDRGDGGVANGAGVRALRRAGMTDPIRRGRGGGGGVLEGLLVGAMQVVALVALGAGDGREAWHGSGASGAARRRI